MNFKTNIVMKKEIKTYEELAKCHLKYFTAIFEGEVIDGTVIVYDDSINLHYNQNISDDIQYLISIHETDVLENSHLSNLIVEIEDWHPKFGELVEVSHNETEWHKRIFLGASNGMCHCVASSKQDNFDDCNKDDYYVLKFKYIRQIEEPKTIEISLEEAKNIIAKEKGVKAEQINLNIK